MSRIAAKLTVGNIFSRGLSMRYVSTTPFYRNEAKPIEETTEVEQAPEIDVTSKKLAEKDKEIVDLKVNLYFFYS